MKPHRSFLFLVLVILTITSAPVRTAFAAGSANDQNRNREAPHLTLSFSVEGNQSALTIKAGQSLNSYKTFVLDSPPRFVLDIENAELSKSYFKMNINRKDLLTVRAAQHGQNVRLVFDLPEDRKTDQKIVDVAEGLKVLISSLSPQDRSVAAPQPAPPPGATGVNRAKQTSPAPIDTAVPMDKPYKGEKISVKLYRASVGDFIRLISDISGVAIEVAPDINDEISLRLQDVPWDQALDLVVSFYGLTMEKRGKGLFLSRGKKQEGK